MCYSVVCDDYTMLMHSGGIKAAQIAEQACGATGQLLSSKLAGHQSTP